MKNFQQLKEELSEIVNSMGGGFDVSGANENPNQHMAGTDPVMDMGRMYRRKKKKKMEVKETFAGCPVFVVTTEEFAKCSHGRNRYERWGKKMNMEDVSNQEIRNYVHKNPGNPIIIKDNTYGVMSYLISPNKTI